MSFDCEMKMISSPVYENHCKRSKFSLFYWLFFITLCVRFSLHSSRKILTKNTEQMKLLVYLFCFEFLTKYVCLLCIFMNSCKSNREELSIFGHLSAFLENVNNKNSLTYHFSHIINLRPIFFTLLHSSLIDIWNFYNFIFKLFELAGSKRNECKFLRTFDPHKNSKNNTINCHDWANTFKQIDLNEYSYYICLLCMDPNWTKSCMVVRNDFPLIFITVKYLHSWDVLVPN